MFKNLLRNQRNYNAIKENILQRIVFYSNVALSSSARIGISEEKNRKVELDEIKFFEARNESIINVNSDRTIKNKINVNEKNEIVHSQVGRLYNSILDKNRVAIFELVNHLFAVKLKKMTLTERAINKAMKKNLISGLELFFGMKFKRIFGEIKEIYCLETKGESVRLSEEEAAERIYMGTIVILRLNYFIKHLEARVVMGKNNTVWVSELLKQYTNECDDEAYLKKIMECIINLQAKYDVYFDEFHFYTLLLAASSIHNHKLVGIIYKAAIESIDRSSKNHNLIGGAMFQHFTQRNFTMQTEKINIKEILDNMSELKEKDYYWVMAYYGKMGDIVNTVSYYYKAKKRFGGISTPLQLKGLYNGIYQASKQFVDKNSLFNENPSIGGKRKVLIKTCLDEYKEFMLDKSETCKYTLAALSNALVVLNESDNSISIFKYIIKNYPSISGPVLINILEMYKKRGINHFKILGAIERPKLNFILSKTKPIRLLNLGITPPENIKRNESRQLATINNFSYSSVVFSEITQPVHAAFYLNRILNGNLFCTHNDVYEQVIHVFEQCIANSVNIYGNQILSVILPHIYRFKAERHTSSILSFIYDSAHQSTVQNFLEFCHENRVRVSTSLINSYLQSRKNLGLVTPEEIKELWFSFFRPHLLDTNVSSHYVPDYYTVSTIIDTASKMKFFEVGFMVWNSLKTDILYLESHFPHRNKNLLEISIFYSYFRLLLASNNIHYHGRKGAERIRMKNNYIKNTIESKEGSSTEEYHGYMAAEFSEKVLDMLDFLKSIRFTGDPLPFLCNVAISCLELDQPDILPLLSCIFLDFGYKKISVKFNNSTVYLC